MIHTIVTRTVDLMIGLRIHTNRDVDNDALATEYVVYLGTKPARELAEKLIHYADLVDQDIKELVEKGVDLVEPMQEPTTFQCRDDNDVDFEFDRDITDPKQIAISAANQVVSPEEEEWPMNFHVLEVKPGGEILNRWVFPLVYRTGFFVEGEETI